MSETVERIECEPVTTLEIKERAPMWRMPMLVGKSFKRIATHLEAAGVEPSGAPYIRYVNLDWEALQNQSKFRMFIDAFTKQWDMLIGFQVPQGTAGGGDILPGTIPGGSYVRAIHHGPYRKVGNTYNRMTAWVKEHNLTMQDECIECYSNDPRTTKPEDLETIVLIGVKG